MVDPIYTTDALVAQGALQLAERVRDLPEPYVTSSKRKCSRCGEEVWISLGAFPLVDRLTIVCRPCLEGQFLS